MEEQQEADEEGTEAEMDEEYEDSEEYEESYYEEEISEYSSSETVEAWSSEVELTEVGYEEYSFHVTMPASGGAYHTEAEMGINSDDDPMNYPFIWTNEGSPLNFEMIMLGVYDNGAPIDDAAFAQIQASEHASMLAEFPNPVVEDELLPAENADQYDWLFSAYWTADGTGEVAKFSTYDGSDYYSLFFFGPAKVDNVDQNWAQMMTVLSSFELE